MLGHGIESDAGDHRVGPGKRLVESRVVHVVRITEHHPGNGIIVGVLIGELINAPGLEATEDILRTVGLVLPVIDDRFTVDQQPVTVVSTRRKIEVRIGGGFIIERIAIRIVVIDNTRYGRSRVFGIDPHDNGRMYGSAGKIFRVEILDPGPRHSACFIGIECGEIGLPARGVVQRSVFPAHLPHPLGHGTTLERIDHPATATRDDRVGVGTTNDYLALGERQQAVVLEQHHTRACYLEGHTVRIGITLADPLVLLRTVEKTEGEKRLENVLYLRIDERLIDNAILDERHDFGTVHHPTAGHLDVEAVEHGPERRVSPSPIRHQNPFESPTVTQYIDVEIAVLRGVNAIDEMVAAHQGADPGPADSLFERRQINFM